MSQHDFTIDNQTFPTTRSDINSALQALASLSSGASAPSTTFAYQLWVNTTSDPNILNVRNSANNAWIKIGEINQGSAAFILTAYAILQAGSAAAPSFSFDTDRDTGMYRAAANIIGFATNGTERVRINDSGQAEFSSGTAALPSITVIGDVNTGMLFPAADTVAVSTGGTEKMRIDSSGNVGIGRVPTANFPLDISAAIGNIRLTSSTGTNYSQLQTINGSGTARFGVESSSGGSIVGGSSAYSAVVSQAGAYSLHLGTNNTVRVTIDSSGIVTGTAGNLMLVSGTSASATGTSINFTSIPSWVKRVTVMFSGISTGGTSNLLVQLGYGATPTYVTSGYLGSATTQGGTSTSLTTGFMVSSSVAAADGFSGIATITNITGNAWTMTSMVGNTTNNNVRYCAGNVSTTTVLTAVRITTVNGTDSYDAGTINIFYE